MSQTAYEHFTLEQRKKLLRYGKLLPVQIPTIEAIGGGSARCMLEEVFLKNLHKHCDDTVQLTTPAGRDLMLQKHNIATKRLLS